MHIDDFIDDLHSDPYAAWVFSHLRLPALQRIRFGKFMTEHKLFCSYGLGDGSRRYRVIGASRLGDVWLTSDFTRDTGYELRVDVEHCSAWGPHP
jgi:hypothetical protein